MSHHDHDAGLVHEHGWACSDNTRATAHGAATEWRFHARARHAGGGHGEEPHGYDDGLVHDHSWARD